MIKLSLLDTLKKGKLPEELPKDIERLVAELKETRDKKACLEKAYSVLTTKYKGYRFKTLYNPHYFLINDLEKLWAKSGFIYCNQMNYLLRLLLIKSEWFKDEDIELKWTLIWYISLHQYCKIKINDNKYINVDIWGTAHGFRLGDYAHGFHRGCSIKF